MEVKPRSKSWRREVTFGCRCCCYSRVSRWVGEHLQEKAPAHMTDPSQTFGRKTLGIKVDQVKWKVVNVKQRTAASCWKEQLKARMG